MAEGQVFIPNRTRGKVRHGGELRFNAHNVSIWYENLIMSSDLSPSFFETFPLVSIYLGVGPQVSLLINTQKDR